MNEEFLFMLEGQEELYPINMEEKFPRIMNRIVELWNTNEIDAYLTELLIDNRGGARQGFPPNVASEIFALNIAHAKSLEKAQQRAAGSNVWDNVEASKKAAIEQEGYKYSQTGFIQSAEKGDEHAVLMFLNCGVDIDTRDERGWTPLMISSFNGREKVAELLIRRGANIHAKDNEGYGPLHWAALNGFSRVVRLLIEKRANVNERSNFGLTPLLQAASRGHLLTAGQLIAGGSNVDLASNDGWTPLHKAAANGHTETVKLLLAKGAYHSPEYQDGTTPLALASKNKHADIEILLTAARK